MRRRILSAFAVIGGLTVLVAGAHVESLNAATDPEKLYEAAEEKPVTLPDDPCSYIGFVKEIEGSRELILINDDYNSTAGYYLELSFGRDGKYSFSTEKIAPGESMIVLPGSEIGIGEFEVYQQAYIYQNEKWYPVGSPVQQSITIKEGTI